MRRLYGATSPKPPPPPARQPNSYAGAAFLSAIVLTLATVAPVKLTIRPSGLRRFLPRFRPHRKLGFAWFDYDDLRRALGESMPYQDGRITAQFRLSGGSRAEVHPTNPYLVRFDAETGASIQTIEYGKAGHPLSWLADVRDPKLGIKNGPESTFFFVVPKSSGGKMKTIMTNCYNLRRAEKREEPESMTYIRGVLNVDTHTRAGLAKARSSNLIDQGLIDVFATSYFFEGMQLFTPSHKGRAFTILEHPVRRAESMYRSHQPDGGLDGLRDYLESLDYIDNWIVRSLSNDKGGTLTEDHLRVAKGILAQKFLVGIADYLEESLKRLEVYYGWEESDNKGCARNYLNSHRVKDEEFAIERGSDEWNLVAQKDQYDLQLYYYALRLFNKQATTMFHRPFVDKTGTPINFLEEREKRQAKELEQQLTAILGR